MKLNKRAMVGVLEFVGLLTAWALPCAACAVLILSQANVFSLRHWLWLTLACGVAGAVLFRSTIKIKSDKSEWLFMGGIVLLLAIVGVFITPSNKYLGGWDTGSYVNIASEISRSGKLSVTDSFLAELPSEERTAYMHKSEPPRLGWHVGYQIVDADKGLLIPDFYHLYPSWLALWSAWGGLKGIWIGHGVLALFALLMLALAGESLFGKKTAFLAVSLFTLCPIQAYIMKTTMAELFTQFALFAGIWALSRMFRNKTHSGLFAATAGLAWMAALLTHATAMLPIGVGLVYLVVYARHEWESGRWKLILPVAACVGMGIAWNWAQSEELTAFVLEMVSSNTIWWTSGLLLLILVLTILMRVRFLPFILVCLGLIAGYWIRPKMFPGPEAINLTVFIELLGWMGLVAALAFFWNRKGRDWPEDVRMLVFMGFVVTGVLLVNKRASPFYLWASRRWIEFALPCMFLLAAAGLIRLGQRLEVWHSRFRGSGLLVVGALACVWGWELWPHARLVYETREYEKMPKAFGRLAQKLGDANYILCERWDIPAVLRYTYGLPAWGLSRTEGKQAIEDSRFATERMRRWATQGSQVYWIGSWFADPVLRLTEVARLWADGRVIELSSDRLPSQVVVDPLRATVYQVSTTGGEVHRGVDIGSSSMGIIRGFGNVKLAKTRTGTFFNYRRIIQATASFYVPVHPGKWRIRMAQIDPVEEITDVIIRINGQTVETFEVNEAWSDYYFLMPATPYPYATFEIEVKPDRFVKQRDMVGVDFVMYAGPSG